MSTLLTVNNSADGTITTYELNMRRTEDLNSIFTHLVRCIQDGEPCIHFDIAGDKATSVIIPKGVYDRCTFELHEWDDYGNQ